MKIESPLYFENREFKWGDLLFYQGQLSMITTDPYERHDKGFQAGQGAAIVELKSGIQMFRVDTLEELNKMFQPAYYPLHAELVIKDGEADE